MTTLLLTVQKIVPPISIRIRVARLEDYFFTMNARGVLTLLSLGVLLAGIAGYLGLLGHMFHLGIQLRAASANEVQEERNVKNLELALREREANFMIRYQNEIKDMEKVSSLTYLESGSVAINLTK